MGRDGITSNIGNYGEPLQRASLWSNNLLNVNHCGAYNPLDKSKWDLTVQYYGYLVDCRLPMFDKTIIKM